MTGHLELGLDVNLTTRVGYRAGRLEGACVFLLVYRVRQWELAASRAGHGFDGDLCRK